MWEVAVSHPIEPMTPSEFEASDGLGDWRVLGDGAAAHFPTTSIAHAARLVQAIAELDGSLELAPAIDVRRDGVTVRLLTLSADYAGMTRADAALARAVSEAAAGLGLRADPTALQSTLIVPGAPDVTAIMPFWRAVLGYEPRVDSPDEDLVDPRDRNVPFWFEQMREPRADGGGAIHVAVFVPRELAEERVRSVLAAGGRLVRDQFAPSWWTLADAAGNEADVASVEGRD